MANKPFAIQGSTLTIGGVDLQAGTTGVVIPGVTQAVNYFAEEVERLNTIGGNNPNTFGSDANAITVIDNAEYLYLVDDGDTPSADYVAATYSVDELDDGRIEEVDVESAGVFLSADKTRVEAANMWATTTPTPFATFNSANWTQIPYRPKMRAGAVENVGGGGGASDLGDLDDVQLEDPSNGQVLTWNNSQEKWENQDPATGNANTGNFTFDANTIANDNDASIVVGGSSLGNIEVNAVDEWGPPEGPGGVWRLFIGDEAYPTLGTTVQIGDTVTTSWGTPITATIVDIQQDNGNWQIHVDQDITAGHNDYDTVTFSTVVTTKTWTFGTDGDLYIPPGKTIRDAMSGDNLLGGADTTVSYKGFKAVYARMYDDEPTISKVLIYQDTVTTTPTLEVDPDTDDDLFKVSGLANSSVIALVNIYGADNTHPTALSTLQHFAKSIIDNVILDNGDAGTNIDAYNMRTKFYDNFDTFASRAGERYKNFEFLREEWSNISGTGGSGTGATFYLERDPSDDVINYASTTQKGINYQVGNVITILGASLGGTTPANNIVITVTEVGVGGRIDAFTYTGILPADLWPLDNIDDGGSDQYDNGNYIFTNIQGDSYQDGDNDSQWAVNYNGGNVNESGAAWFGTGSEYVTTYKDSIFGLFVTGANINWIATNGNSGFDGDGQADTGSLQLVDTDGLINGDQSFVLNADGSVTFPDGTTQTTAYTEGDPNVWVQDFEPTAIGEPTDTVASANSVEYLGNGDIVAVFQHYYEEGQGTYNTIGRFTPTGEKVWSMKFQGDVYTDGWGLAVNNDGGYIFLAGQKGGSTGYNSATLTKLAQADGAIVWSKTYDVGYTNSNVVVDMAGSDPIVVGYAYNGTDTRIVTTKIDGGTGAVIWSKALDGQGNDEAYGMAVNYNSIVTVGYVDSYGPTDSVATAVTEPTSNVNWTTPFVNVLTNGVNFDVNITGGVPTITINTDDTGGRVVGDTFATILGSTLGGVNGVDDMIVKVGTLAANDTDNRMVVVKYDNTGAIQWQRAVQVEPGYDCTGADAAIDGDGNIYVCGNFEYDNGNGEDGEVDQSMILIKFNQSGTKKWTRKVQGPCEDYASSVVVGPDNCLYLSAYTASADEDYSMVIAKYNLDGTVAWQRLLDSLTNWTFAGQFFFGPGGGGGSTIAVRDGYVAVVGGVINFNVYSTPRAIIAQFGTDGKIFTRGDYDFKAATFSGLLNTTASNITVSDAGKVSSDYDEEFTVGDFEPDFDLTSDLVGTVYRSINAGNELVNGNYTASLNANGSLTLPAGGTVSEGYVTSNPTIQLTPARPDVASQKLVIKGGGIPFYLENGIEVSVNYTTRTVGQTLEVDVNSNTYTSQTLYWWINPEGVGISDPESGTVTLNGSGYGSFSIVVDSDDYEFRVRVSPEDHNYGPGVIGAQSVLINSGEPTVSYEHHLHLTTGNLAETSILLGTDNHNVRTTTDGGIEITTETTTVNPPDTITITGADVAGVNLVYTRDPSEQTPTWTSPVVNPATDPFIEFDVQWRILAPEIDPLLPIYVNAGTLAKPFTQWSLNPPYGTTAPTGVYTYLALDVHAWTFGPDGTVTFPTLTVPLEDNANPIGTGQVLKFSDSTQQAIIFGPVSTATNTSAERVIIQGAPGYTGTTGEGGDVYVWAGPGGSADGQGGDIKVRAGQGIGSGNGGYLNFQAGDSATGDGGWINIESGYSNTQGQGGDITVWARRGGEIFLRTDNGTTNLNWTFGADGNLTLPKASKVSEVTPATGPAPSIYPNPSISSIPNEDFVTVPPPAVNNYTIPGTDIVINMTFGANGPNLYGPTATIVNGGTGHTSDESLSIPYADMGIDLGGNWPWFVNTIASNLVLEAGTKDWTFAADGVITLPNGMSIDSYGTLGVNAVADIGGDDTYITIDNNGAPPGLTITTNGTAGMGQRQWRFDPDGDLTFPDATVQSTAYTGTAATATSTSTADSVGYIGMPQNSKSANYELVIGDMGKHIYVTATSTVTVPSYTSVDFPIGTTIAVVAGTGATVSIAITTDTMNLAGPGTTGTRTLAPFGMATLVKVAQSSWFISGVGLT